MVKGNIYGVTETHGVPIDNVAILLSQRDLVVDWEDYVRKGLEAGANPSTLRSKMIEVANELYRNEDREAFLRRTDLLFNKIMLLSSSG